jgi:hypothetical protein
MDQTSRAGHIEAVRRAGYTIVENAIEDYSCAQA